MFTPDIKLGGPKCPALCRFSIRRSIYSTNLSEEVRRQLIFQRVQPDTSKYYLIDVSFSVAAYGCKNFWKFPTGCRATQIERQKGSPREWTEAYINAVLSQQLKSICREISGLGIKYRYALIAGENFKDAWRVRLRIYEDAATNVEVTTQTDQRKAYRPSVYVVIPHRPSLVKDLAERVGQCFIT